MAQILRQGRHLPLDFLRGLAAFGIALYHYLIWTKVTTVESLGRFGVYTFFILSALTMSMVYDRTFSSGLSGWSLRAFYRNRIARIVPLLGAVAVFNLTRSLGHAEQPMIDIIKAFLTGTTLFSLHMPGYLSNSTGAWSLGIEMAFYAVFPVLLVLAKDMRPREAIVCLLLLLAGQQALLIRLAADFPNDVRQHWQYFSTPLMFAPFFAIGMLAYFKPLPMRRGNFLVGSAIFVAAMASSLFVKADVVQSPLYFMILTGACGASVALLYRSEIPPVLGRLSKFIGDISYSLYLTHRFAFLISAAVAKRLGFAAPLSFLLFIAFAAALAYLSFRFFEMPVRNLLRSKSGLDQDAGNARPPAERNDTRPCASEG